MNSHLFDLTDHMYKVALYNEQKSFFFWIKKFRLKPIWKEECYYFASITLTAHFLLSTEQLKSKTVQPCPGRNSINESLTNSEIEFSFWKRLNKWQETFIWNICRIKSTDSNSYFDWVLYLCFLIISNRIYWLKIDTLMTKQI